MGARNNVWLYWAELVLYFCRSNESTCRLVLAMVKDLRRMSGKSSVCWSRICNLPQHKTCLSSRTILGTPFHSSSFCPIWQDCSSFIHPSIHYNRSFIQPVDPPPICRQDCSLLSTHARTLIGGGAFCFHFEFLVLWTDDSRHTCLYFTQRVDSRGGKFSEGVQRVGKRCWGSGHLVGPPLHSTDLQTLITLWCDVTVLIRMLSGNLIVFSRFPIFICSLCFCNSIISRRTNEFLDNWPWLTSSSSSSSSSS